VLSPCPESPAIVYNTGPYGFLRGDIRMSSNSRVGVSGSGLPRKIHGPYLVEPCRMSELVGVVDADPATAGPHRYPNTQCTAYAKPEELLGKVDARQHRRTHDFHLAGCSPVLESGVHMLMEKPIAPNLRRGPATGGTGRTRWRHLPGRSSGTLQRPVSWSW